MVTLKPDGTIKCAVPVTLNAKVRGLSAYAGKSFESIVIEEIAELKALGIDVRYVAP